MEKRVHKRKEFYPVGHLFYGECKGTVCGWDNKDGQFLLTDNWDDVTCGKCKQGPAYEERESIKLV